MWIPWFRWCSNSWIGVGINIFCFVKRQILSPLIPPLPLFDFRDCRVVSTVSDTVLPDSDNIKARLKFEGKIMFRKTLLSQAWLGDGWGTFWWLSGYVISVILLLPRYGVQRMPGIQVTELSWWQNTSTLAFRYRNLPKEITNQYDLILISNNGYAMIEIRQDKYELP